MSEFFFPKDPTNKYTYSFGMVTTISKRLEDAYKAKEQALTSDCLDLVPVIKEEVDKFKRENFPSLKNGKNVKLDGSMEAWRRGMLDGEKIALSRPIAGNGEKREKLN